MTTMADINALVERLIGVINERFAAIDKRIEELDQRTEDLIRMGPGPKHAEEEVPVLKREIEKLIREKKTIRESFVDQARQFPSHSTPAIPEVMPEELRKDRPPTGITDDPNDPRIRRGAPDKESVPQAEAYLVLPEDERAKGFVRPYRDAYQHVGLKPKFPERMRTLTVEEMRRHREQEYVRFEEYPESELPSLGRYWTRAQLDTKGCGTVTTMGRALSETYARDPSFYGATYCCGCRKHLPVEEFVWTVDGERVGS